MDPGKDHIVDRAAFPLWGHMANSLDGVEVEAVTLLCVARHLTVCGPGAPFILDLPSEFVDPLLGAIGWHCSIGVSRVEHHAVAVLEEGVDPVGGLSTHGVVDVRALLPCLHI